MAGKIATRNAYGEALVALAEKYPQLVVLDADLSSATMTTAWPNRMAKHTAPSIVRIATWIHWVVIRK